MSIFRCCDCCCEIFIERCSSVNGISSDLLMNIDDDPRGTITIANQEIKDGRTRPPEISPRNRYDDLSSILSCDRLPKAFNNIIDSLLSKIYIAVHWVYTSNIDHTRFTKPRQNIGTIDRIKSIDWFHPFIFDSHLIASEAARILFGFEIFPSSIYFTDCQQLIWKQKWQKTFDRYKI